MLRRMLHHAVHTFMQFTHSCSTHIHTRVGETSVTIQSNTLPTNVDKAAARMLRRSTAEEPVCGDEQY